MKKRAIWIIAAILIAAVMLFTVACKKETPAAGQEAAPTVQKPGAGMYFRLVTHGGDDPFWAVVQQGMRDAAEELGCRADIALSGGDLAKQLKDFQEAVASKPDGIALVINDLTAWNKPVADALAAGIPVIGINNDAPENPRLCYIGQSETVAAYKLAKYIFEAAKAKGVNFATAHVGFAAEVPGATYAQVRAQGVKDAMAEYGIKSFEMIDAGGLEATTVESRITAYLTSRPETTFIMGAGGICTDRLMSSLKSAGKNPGEIYAGGFDAAPATLEGLATGYLLASIDQQQYLQGYLAIYAMYLYKKYGLTPNVDTGGYLITPDRVDMIKDLSGKYR